MSILFVQIAAAIAGLYLAPRLIGGFEFNGGITDLLFAGAILGLLNTFLKPVLRFVFAPIRFLTLGIFTIVIDAGILFAVDLYLASVRIHGIVPLLWATLLLSLLAVIFHWMFASKKKA